MFKKLVLLVSIVVMVFATTACVFFVSNGDELTVKTDTICWQCPKGNNLSRWDKIYNCANQRNWGTIAENDIIIADSGDFWTPVQSGYVRVNAFTFAVNPSTGEKIVDQDQRICWVDLTDLKKK
jgi:hypothetical protein